MYQIHRVSGEEDVVQRNCGSQMRNVQQVVDGRGWGGSQTYAVHYIPVCTYTCL